MQYENVDPIFLLFIAKVVLYIPLFFLLDVFNKKVRLPTVFKRVAFEGTENN